MQNIKSWLRFQDFEKLRFHPTLTYKNLGNFLLNYKDRELIFCMLSYFLLFNKSYLAFTFFFTGPRRKEVGGKGGNLNDN